MWPPTCRDTPARATRMGLKGAARAGMLLAGLCLVLAASGCAATGHPPPIRANELAEAKAFPFFRVYWVGPRFDGRPLAAADGLKGYITTIGDSVYYGDCVQSKGIFGGGSCQLPLQITTVIYHLHSNATLGPQHNILIRGVPATVYDEGRSIELYSGQVAIDIFSDDFTHALQAAQELRPLNAPGSASARLPPPIYCPELAGAQEVGVERVMVRLPGHACQRAAASVAFAKQLKGSR
jgi:hypothetical protein